jgi:geranylgeranyl reductase family protein
MARIRDVVVIGAGPAGAGTAARLHQRGVRDVLVLDRARFPRDKPCGGGLTGRAADALDELGLRLAVPHAPSGVARVRFGTFERAVALARPVNVIRRADFDASLVEQVEALGVEVRTAARVEALDVGRDAVSLRLDTGEELAARIVVGADGVGSIVRKRLCRGQRHSPHRLFVQEVEAPASGRAMLYDFTPMREGLRGYLWAFPLADGRANVGVMHYPSTRLDGPALRRMLRDGLARHGVELSSRGARGWPAWGYHPRAPVAASRMLTVGDAAGIDALTGEGIAVALEHGRIAGDAAASALATGDFRFADYPRTLRRAVVGRELNLDRWLAARLYQAGPGWQRWVGLALLDADVLELYAARVAGTEVLADQKLRLLRTLARRWAQWRRRRLELEAATS